MYTFSFRNFLHKSVISADGIKADSVENMSPPQNKEELKSFLGLVNNLGKFVPNLSDFTAPLHQLLKNDSEWIFNYPYIQAFDKLESEITNASVLKDFDPELPTRVSCDASSYGLRTVLDQFNSGNWYPIA